MVLLEAFVVRGHRAGEIVITPGHVEMRLPRRGMRGLDRGFALLVRTPAEIKSIAFHHPTPMSARSATT